MEPQVSAPGPTAKLRRSRSDRVIGGVCGGLGQFLGIDSVVIRVVMVVLVAFGGSGVLLYLIGWLVIPEAPDDHAGGDAEEARPSTVDAARTARVVVGAVLLGVGVLTLAHELVPAFSSLVGPLILVAAGGGVLFLGVTRSGDETDPAWDGAAAPPAGGSTFLTTEPYALPDDPPSAAAAPMAAPVEARPHHGRVVLGLLLVVGGVLWLLDLGEVLALDWLVVLPAALVVVGLAAVVLAWTGRSAGGLVGWGVVLTVVVVAANVFPVPISASMGDRSEAPTALSQLEDEYRLGIGTLTVDLRGLRFDADRTVEAGVGLGELVVLVPTDVELEISSQVGVGEATVLERSSSGVRVDLEVSFPAEDQAADAPTLALDLSVGLGSIEVRR